MGKLQIEYRSIESILPYEKNPRINDGAVPAVMESIKEFGFKIPIVLTANNVIVAGHTRIKAAMQMGMKEVPCVIADDLSEEQIKAFRLADNKSAEIATWDEELLQQELSGRIAYHSRSITLTNVQNISDRHSFLLLPSKEFEFLAFALFTTGGNML